MCGSKVSNKKILLGTNNKRVRPSVVIVVPVVFKTLCALRASAVKMDSGLRRNDGKITATADLFAPSRFK